MPIVLHFYFIVGKQITQSVCLSVCMKSVVDYDIIVPVMLIREFTVSVCAM